MDRLSYPIGQFTPMQEMTDERPKQVIGSMTETPDRLRHAVKGLGLEQLATPYRSGGWIVQQVVHHLADAERAILIS